MKRSELIFSVLLVPVDYIMLVLAGVATYLIRTNVIDALRPVAFAAKLPFEKYLLTVVVAAAVFVLMYAFSGLYSLRATRRFLEEFGRIAIASSAGLMVVIIFIFLRAELFNSRFLVLGAWVMGIIFVALGRWIMRRLQRWLVISRGLGAHRVLVIGDDEITKQVIDHMRSDPGLGYGIVKQLAHPDVDQIRDIIGDIDEVILTNPNYPADRVVELIDFCHENHLGFRFVPNLYQTLTKNFSFDTFTGVPFVELRRTALDGWGRVFKRTIDLVGSLVGLIILSPLLLLIFLLIKMDSIGDAIYRSTRVSRGKRFVFYKFRSMRQNAEQLKPELEQFNERNGSPLFKMKNDPRVTRLGRFLRRYRLDELPQLWNVLKGDIALVGPRPHLLHEIAQYEKHHKRVLAIKAGITGMAQISGSSDLPFEEEVALDTLYIETWSLWLDAKILILTMLKLVRDRSAV